ncbi:hypothetical protein [Azospirillum argentinense]|uniref:hypothetical protein n=1 Tax=Azospirillum argentinense TaxID=2970906 RepID=UPI0032E0522A
MARKDSIFIVSEPQPNGGFVDLLVDLLADLRPRMAPVLLDEEDPMATFDGRAAAREEAEELAARWD